MTRSYWIAGFALLFAAPNVISSTEIAADEIRFDQHVRPILSNLCWNCHGQDEHSRMGGLRLDSRDDAIRGGDSGLPAVTPGSPELSQLLLRIDSSDPDVRMPPPTAAKQLTDDQRRILRDWVQQGAEYAAHWAFQTPIRVSPPAVRDQTWPKRPLDHFILHRLESERLSPAAEAAPNIWLRRVTLDLTGLLPSPEELQAFQDDLAVSPRDAVYARVVDRLLESPQYGERMAMAWLDAARYADTNGYNNDETRTMWPWRDWVIQSFRDGMPYDQFLTEQIAGDLLPEPSVSQRVATGFCRNHVLTTEGGIIEEEYHVEYVADRVHTTATVFMAMSLQCARCHDHKYDPVSQREYYQFSAFFNNVPDRVVSYNQTRMAEPLLRVPSPEQTAELRRIEARLAEIDDLLKQRTMTVDAEIAAWESSLSPEERTSGAAVGELAHFTFDEEDGNQVINRADPVHPASIHGPVKRESREDGRALVFDGGTFVDAGQIGDLDGDDRFTVMAKVKLTTSLPAAVLSKIDEGNAYRGYDLILEDRKVAVHFVHRWPDHAFKVITKNSLTLNEWHHLAVTYDGSRRSSGVRIYVDGQPQEIVVTTDNELSGTLRTEKPFHIGRRNSTAPFQGTIDDVLLLAGSRSDAEIASLARGEGGTRLADILQIPGTERSPDEQKLLRQYYLDHLDRISRDLRNEQRELPQIRERIEKEIPATMVMAEADTVRPSYILERGQYDQRRDAVDPDFPMALGSMIRTSDDRRSRDEAATDDSAATASAANDSVATADAEPANNANTAGTANTGRKTRLDLARWLTDPGHPLTSRVAVNRLWELLFGTGIVETSEDFGIQGDLPSHPELLDWLATELIHRQWDQRQIIREIVLSATYRQDSFVSREKKERDPLNRLLSRGPRYRLPAESVRDIALFAGGLLVAKTGGPSVKPYQPDGLWEDVSVERREKYVPDSGEGLYRRSMYTFWKRTCPPPGMATFDAPDREFCVVRRARTNTPLQALVLMNDPTFVEAARKLAERCLLISDDEANCLDLAFRIVLSREPDAEERLTLMNILAEAAAEFRESPQAAGDLIATGNSAASEKIPKESLAAWTTVMSVLLNLDEAISQH